MHSLSYIQVVKRGVNKTKKRRSSNKVAMISDNSSSRFQQLDMIRDENRLGLSLYRKLLYPTNGHSESKHV